MESIKQTKPKQKIKSLLNLFGAQTIQTKDDLQITVNTLIIADSKDQSSFDRAGDLVVKKLNQLISTGIKFHVSACDFEVTGRALSQKEKEYLTTNDDLILCFLQQALLKKRLFSEVPARLNDFTFEIYEREAILSELEGKNSSSSYFDAVRFTTQNWFAELLNNYN